MPTNVIKSEPGENFCMATLVRRLLVFYLAHIMKLVDLAGKSNTQT